MSLIVYLPGNVRHRDVAKVIGKLLGCKSSKDSEGCLTVSGVKCSGYGASLLNCIKMEFSGMGRVVMKWLGCSKSDVIEYMYQMESDHGSDRVILANLNPLNLGVFRGLVDFFGGVVIYDRYDEGIENYDITPKSDHVNQPNVGKEYFDLQDRINRLKPILKKEFEKCKNIVEIKNLKRKMENDNLSDIKGISYWELEKFGYLK